MKEQIIEEALRQIRLGGYNRLNFAEIAHELGTTRANVHHHFKNKERLGIAALEQYIETEEWWLRQILNRHDGDLPSILLAIEVHLVEAVSGEPEKTACAGSQIIRDSAAPESLRTLAIDRFRKEAEEIREQVAKFLKSNSTATSNEVHQMTFDIISTMHGASDVSLFWPDKKSLQSWIKGALTKIIHL